MINTLIKNKEIVIKLLEYNSNDLLDDLHLIFNKKELDKFNSFKSEKRKKEFYFARKLWKSFNIGEDITYAPEGNPKLKHGFISISHSRNKVAIAFSEAFQIGVDIEKISEKILLVKSKFLHPEEKHEDLTSLTKVWCIKESVYKILPNQSVFFMQHIQVVELNEFPIVKIQLENAVFQPKVFLLKLNEDTFLSYCY